METQSHEETKAYETVGGFKDSHLGFWLLVRCNFWKVCVESGVEAN
jgi:hypothetical protein